MQRLRTMHLFAGAGGGILADLLLGHQPVCAVEINEYCQQVLSARQKDGCLPWFPIFADVTQFDGRPWRGIVDIVSGGFPCQDISAAGKGAGIDGDRSSMWKHMARVVREVGPRFVFVENSPMLVSRGLGTVLGDLAALGFDAAWCVLSASDVGAPHIRERIWILAHAREERCGSAQADSELGRQQRLAIRRLAAEWWRREPEQTPREAKPSVGGVADGMASRMDELAAAGNGQVPAVAAMAWRILTANV